MKFFTPDLYAKTNSTEYGVVERAMKEWDIANTAYGEELQKLLPRVDPSVKDFIISARFHDAEVLAAQDKVADRTSWTLPDDHQRDRRIRFFMLSLRTDDSIVCVNYVLRRPFAFATNTELGVFATKRRVWLYDELLIDPNWYETRRGVAVMPEEFVPRPDLVHSILFSDGLELALPFSDVLVTTVPLAKICADFTQPTEIR